MPRTVKEYPFYGQPEALFNAVHQYLLSEGYEYRVYDNENVFKKGKGLASGPTFIKLSFGPNAVRLEAWLKFAALPGVYAGESDLDGFVGAAVKGPLKKRFAQIEQMILQGPPAFQPAQPQAPRFCTNCGAQLMPGAAFCGSCGKSTEQ